VAVSNSELTKFGETEKRALSIESNLRFANKDVQKYDVFMNLAQNIFCACAFCFIDFRSLDFAPVQVCLWKIDNVTRAVL